MFTKSGDQPKVDAALDRAFNKLNDFDVNSDEYEKTLNGIVKLHKLKEDERPSEISKDTMLLVAANLLGILLIIRHEHVNVISSKAMGTLIRPR